MKKILNRVDNSNDLADKWRSCKMPFHLVAFLFFLFGTKKICDADNERFLMKIYY